MFLKGGITLKNKENRKTERFTLSEQFRGKGNLRSRTIHTGTALFAIV